MERVPHGIVERVDDRFVGYCYEVGTSAQGTTVEEAFANLNAATWQALQDRGASDAVPGNAVHHDGADEVSFHLPSETDPNSGALAAMSTMLLDGLGDFEPVNAQQVKP